MVAAARWRQVRAEWAILTYYQRFESLALVLTLVIGLIILVALYRLTVSVLAGLLFGVLDPLDDRVFQTVFGEIMTLLIALARKFIILDTHDITTGLLLGLTAVALALSVSYWLLRERDDRPMKASAAERG